MEVVKSSGANAKIVCLASFIFVLLSDTLYKSLLQSFEWLSSPPPPRSLWSPQNSYSIIATRSGNSSTLACSLFFHCSALLFASSFLLPESFSWNNILVFSTKSFFQVLSWYLLSTLKIYVNGLEWDRDCLMESLFEVFCILLANFTPVILVKIYFVTLLSLSVTE